VKTDRNAEWRVERLFIFVKGFYMAKKKNILEAIKRQKDYVEKSEVKAFLAITEGDGEGTFSLVGEKRDVVHMLAQSLATRSELLDCVLNAFEALVKTAAREE